VTLVDTDRLNRLRTIRVSLEAREAAEREAVLARVYDSEYRRSARPEQLPPDGDWTYWIIKAGRGFGKTWVGARWLRERVLLFPGTEWFIGNKDHDDIRSISIEGPSGFLNACLPGEIAGYNAETGESSGYDKSRARIRMANGSIIHPISGEVPRKGRGKNLAGGWADELASWTYESVWTEGIGPALRTQLVGDHPRVVITSTPKPTPLWRRFAKRTDPAVVFTGGSIFDNADNLSPEALDELRRTYEGTRLGRQELYGEELDDIEGALWTWEMIDQTRITHAPTTLTRVVIGWDPALTSSSTSDEHGIVVAGRDSDGHLYVLADLSGRMTPEAAVAAVLQAFDAWGVDQIVYEKNVGGDFIKALLGAGRRGLPVKDVPAKRGKALRAQPISMLYEQHRVSHAGVFADLEVQMTEWVPDADKDSPDRLDAMVYALTAIAPSLGSSTDALFASLTVECWKCGVANQKKNAACTACGADLHTRELASATSSSPDLTGLGIVRR
jgi:phage terminase large subunit-like protein